jgi:hypothetical protein
MILTAALLLFVAASVAALIVGETTGGRGGAPAAGSSAATQSPEGVSFPAAVAETEALAVSAQEVPDSPETAAPAAMPDAAPSPERRVIAYYFHNTARCPTCRTIERYSWETIQASFAVELRLGRLEWRVVNMEEPGNRHFVADYAIPYPSLVLVEMRGETQIRFKVLDRTWQLVHTTQEAFSGYVRDEVRAYLGEP